MTAGRIDSYLHSDGITQNKCGALVRVKTETDFATREFQFKEFTQRVARLACGFQIDNWKELSIQMPAIEEDRLHLQNYLQEEVLVDKIILLSLADENQE